MTTIFLSLVLFALFMAGMGIGLLLSGRELAGSCGGSGAVDHDGDPLSCGTCARKESEICPTDDELIRIAQLGHPDPAHHR